MSGFLYWIPGAKSASSEVIKRLGLDRVIDDPHGRGAHGNTPSGGAGFTVADKSVDIDLAIKPGEQTWRPAPLLNGEVPYWIGYNDDSKPTPIDLERDHMIEGREVVDAEGVHWLAPQLREWRIDDTIADLPFVCRPTLPRVCDLNEAGDVILGDVIPRYREIFEESWRVASALWPDHVEAESRMSDSEAIKFAGDLLGVNYRVSFLELAVLRSISAEIAREVLRIGIDAEGFEHAAGNLKSRSESETIDSDCGHDRPTTDSPTQTPIAQQSAN